MFWQSAGLLRHRPLPWRCIPTPWQRQVLRLSCGPRRQWIRMSCICWALRLRRTAQQRGVTSHTLVAVCFRGCPLVECPLSSPSTLSSGWYSISLSNAVYKQATCPILVSETCRRSGFFFFGLIFCFSFHTKKSRTIKDSSIHQILCRNLQQTVSWLENKSPCRRERTLLKNP